MSGGRAVVYRTLSAWIATLSRIVPANRRTRWAEEWKSEAWHALASGGGLRQVVRVCSRCATGCVVDALQARRARSETSRARMVPALGHFLEDLRMAARVIRRSPGFAIFTITILSLGIGVNTAVFSLVRDALVGTMPFPESDRLVQVWERRPEQGRDRNVASFPDFVDWRERSTVFTGLAAIRYAELNASGGDRPLPVFGARVTGDFLEVAGVAPELGRGFTADEMRPPGSPVVILSHGLFVEMFGADRDVLGRTLSLDLEPHTIIGVMPPGFTLPYGARFWVPLGQDPVTAFRGSHGYDVIGRMSAGVTVERAWEDLDRVARQLEEAHPESNTGHYTAVYPLRAELLGETRSALIVLLGAVGVVLAIICVNVAILELARSIRRSRDLAVRATMGATPGRLVRQVLAESLVLALVSGLLAAGVATLAHRVLSRLSASSVPWSSAMGFDLGALTLALGVAFVTSVLFGLAPAFQATRVDLAARLRDGSARGGLSLGAKRWQGSLVVVQVALALVLLVGSGVFGRHLVELLRVDVGYDTHGVVAADLSLPDARYTSDEERLQFFVALEERVRTQPGVDAVGTAWILPMSGRNVGRNFVIDGRPAPNTGDELNLRLRAVTPGYFGTMGMRISRGRGIEPQDTRDSPLVAVASQTLVDRYWPDQDAIGERLSWGGDTPWITIVGVVNEILHDGPNSPAEPELYLPLHQAPPSVASIVVRSGAPLEATERMLRSLIAEMDPDQAVARVRTMDETLATWLSRQRELTNLVMAFALAALTLAALGIYSVVAYTVSLRTREFGIRLALGGGARRVLVEAMAGGARLVLLGLAVGLVVAVALARTAGSLLADVRPNDPLVLLLALALLGLIGALATFVPARRATRVDPVTSLKSD